MSVQVAGSAGVGGRGASGWLAVIGVIAACGLGSDIAHAQAPSEREAEAWLAAPPGSTSLGRTNEGELLGPVALPEKGRGYRALSMVRSRKTGFGTRELIDAINRATAAVEARFPGSVLAVGNLGFADGKKIPWSVSHQAGRDADLGMYATTAEGEPLERVLRGPMPFHAFDEGLEARASGRVVRFDVARNLELVRALVAGPDSRVQYIFVAAWLKAALLAEARKAGVDAATQARLAEVLHQPSDSNPHADHFHVRLFCTIEDRVHGCVNRGPARAWVDPGDREHAEAAAQVASILRMKPGRKADKLALRAIERLERMVATSAVPALVEALGDGRAKVRKAALGALAELGDPRAAEGIARLLPTIRDAAWAKALFAAIPALDGDAVVPLAEKVLADPGALLHVDLRRRLAPELTIGAMAVLAKAGTQRHVRLIIEAARKGGAPVEKPADGALARLTCHRFKGSKAWAAFWNGGAKLGEEELIVAGLATRGIELTRGGRSREAVERLIGLLDHRELAVRECSERLLTKVTGHVTDVERPPARNRKHWAHWWRENQATVVLQ